MNTETQKTMDRFVKDGRLCQLPKKHAPRLVILSWLAESFEPGQRYPETRVNAMLDGHALDYAALRRLLVDYGFLARDQGIYWRVESQSA